MRKIMKRNRFLSPLVLVLIVLSPTARAAQDEDNESFHLTAVPPPLPAMRYELLVDPIDQQSGNAADYYRDVFQQMTPDLKEETYKAYEAAEKDGAEALNSMETALAPKTQALLDLLEKASRQDHCDWNSHIREHGLTTRLPYLNGTRIAARMALAQAVWKIHQGKTTDALAKLRVCFELGQNSASEPLLVNALVAEQIHIMTVRGLIELMNHPAAPNLYWALATLPRPLLSARRPLEGERLALFATIPLLVKARTGELSADEWRAVFKSLADVSAKMSTAQRVTEQAMLEAAMPLLPDAQDYYAKTRRLAIGEVAKIEPVKVIGVYLFEQYQAQLDDLYKLVELPRPLLFAKMQAYGDVLKVTINDHPENPFLALMPSLSGRVSEMTMGIDRPIAALTAVEAIRSYAAINQGKLPAALSDIFDTPAPDNPRTGKPFEYSLQGETATLSDSGPENHPLTYTIRIRK
jgi:hypothetical protein